MRKHAILLTLALLAACSGSQENAKKHPAPPPNAIFTESEIPGPQVPPVEFGHRPPSAPMTSANMPFFDAVTYCEHATRKADKIFKGPHYEACVEDQAHYRIIIGEAIDARRYAEAVIDRCAKASRTAYQGMWFCMNSQVY